MRFFSSAFENGKLIPRKYSFEAENLNPPLQIEEVPQAALSLAILVEDPDAPVGIWTHWLVFNLPIDLKVIKEGIEISSGIVGKNSWGKNEYGGPCPPSGEHRYFFRLFALKEMLSLSKEISREDFLTAIQGKILDQVKFFGVFSR